MKKPTFTIIAPVYNEAESLPELYRRVKEVMDSTGEAWELVRHWLDRAGDHHLWRLESAQGCAGFLPVDFPTVAGHCFAAQPAECAFTGAAGGAIPVDDSHPAVGQHWQHGMGGSDAGSLARGGAQDDYTHHARPSILPAGVAGCAF